jgi:hypothetical protein
LSLITLSLLLVGRSALLVVLLLLRVPVVVSHDGFSFFTARFGVRTIRKRPRTPDVPPVKPP